MCGICFVLFFRSDVSGDHFNISNGFYQELTEKLKSRGPDDFQEIRISAEKSHELNFYSSVLHLRGSFLESQPVQDDRGNVLLWNGEIFDGKLCQSLLSDTKVLSEKLFHCSNVQEVLEVVGLIRGPYSIIFYQKSCNLLWFGRDIFGRRSLLWTVNDDSFKLCSVSFGTEKWQDVPTSGLFCLDLNEKDSKIPFSIYCFPWSKSSSGLSPCHIENNFNSKKLILKTDESNVIQSPIMNSLNRSLTSVENSIKDCSKISSVDEMRTLGILLEDSNFKNNVDRFEDVLSEAVKKRVQNQPYLCKVCYKNKCSSCDHSSVGILFSGGLDSIVIAALAHRYLPEDQSIDLLNVAFASNEKLKDKCLKSTSAFNTPDRLTGRSGALALKEICPSRKWNFIEIDISEEVLVTQRKSRINQLLTPNCTVLDDSIGCAIWFAARGEGFILCEGSYTNYKSSARVLLVGMGADEQLGGYSRHRAKYNNCGWKGLMDELALELDRIGSRNLGRDDRIISDNGVESRYPFLDENLVSYLNELPIWLKMDLSLPRGLGEKLLLRLLAYKIGLLEAAVLPKRAIQFGSRIAKIENSKEKGSDICERLKEL